LINIDDKIDILIFVRDETSTASIVNALEYNTIVY